jgi:hypothetical protein
MNPDRRRRFRLGQRGPGLRLWCLAAWLRGRAVRPKLAYFEHPTVARFGDLDRPIVLNVDQHVLNREALFPKLVQTGFQRRHPVLGVHPKGHADPAGIRRGDVDFKPGHATSLQLLLRRRTGALTKGAPSLGMQSKILFVFARAGHGRM